MHHDLHGKVAMITGSAKGIGRGIARRFAQEGCRLVLNDIAEDALEAAAAELREQGAQVLTLVADVGNRQQVEQMFAQAQAWRGGVDVLVNNAGWSVPVSHLLEMTEAHWDDVIRTNLKSMFLCTQAAARAMVDTGRAGSIVCLSSFGAARAHRAMAAYDASKGGVEAFTRAAALDLAPFGVRVNAIGPGAIHTEFFDHEGVQGQRQRARPVPLGRVGQVQDVAGGAAFLASSDAAYITGQVLYIDGGMHAQLRPPEMDRPLPDSLHALRPADPTLHDQ
jgi:NAD(P)-dependent dehydrogenase (short-subunit alcohol dehydrogenase family)